MLDELSKDPDFQSDSLLNRGQKKKSSPLMRALMVFGILFGIVAVVGAGIAFYLYEIRYKGTLNSAVANEGESQTFIIEPGQSVQQIGDMLEEQGLIQDSFIFRLAVQFQEKDSQFIAGEFSLSPAQTTQEIIDLIATGQVAEQEQIVIQIKPGWRIEEVADYLVGEGLVDREEYLARSVAANYSSYAFLSTEAPFSTPADATLEGFMFPDTYFLPDEPSIDDINIRVLNNFQSKYEENLAGLDYSGLTFYELLVLASIVEKEANLYESKRHVAQIYINRVDLGMSLGADPTVAYALGDWRAQLNYETLRIDSPYNTRLYAGIPPGPISSPGLDSLKSMVDPADTTALFFLADAEGIMRYATTNAEHEYNKATYGLLEP